MATSNNLNEQLMKSTSFELASKKINSIDGIKEILLFFKDLDPYVQCIILQSVLFLSSIEFENIKEYYLNLINIANQSTDEWVRQFSIIFKNYPNINIPDEIPLFEGNLNEIIFNDPFQKPINNINDKKHFNLKENEKIHYTPPPSKQYSQTNRIIKNNQNNNPLSIAQQNFVPIIQKQKKIKDSKILD